MINTDRIIYVCMGALLVLTLISFFVAPSYEKGVWIGYGAFGGALTTAIGAKFGMAMPGKDAPKPPVPTPDLPPEA